MPTLGSGTNEIQTFGLGDGANVETPAVWQADEVRQQGFQNGIANATQANTALRQASFIATMLAQFMADYSGVATEDDGVVLDAEANLIAALKALFGPFGVYFITDTGTANKMVGTSDPAPESYTTPSFIVIKKMNANNTGAMTCNFWTLGDKTLKDNTGADLASGALLANSFYMLTYDGGGFRVLGGTTTYSSVTNLTANSGDMVEVTVDGVCNFRTLRGNHNITVLDGDKWPRGKQTDDTAQYMLTTEFIAWITSLLPSSLVNFQVFTSSGTYTPTTGAHKALVFLTGGGASGGVGPNHPGGGGAAGGTALKFITISGGFSITIGAGGAATSSGRGFDGGNSTISALSMTGFGGASAQAVPYGSGSIGGEASGGNINMRGGPGDGYGTINQTPFTAGAGGNSFWSGGGQGNSANSTLNPAQSGLYGSGGGGGYWAGDTSGAGGNGVAVIIEFS